MIGVVVDGRILEQFARGAFAGLKPVSNIRQFVDGVLQLPGEFFILQQLARGTAAGIQIVHQLVGLGNGLVDVGVKRFILDQLAQISFAGIDFIHHAVQLIDGVIGLEVKGLVSKKLPDRSPAIVHIIQEPLHLVQNAIDLVDHRGIVDDLAQGALVTLHRRQDVISACYQDVNVLQRALAAANNIPIIRNVAGGQHGAVCYR